MDFSKVTRGLNKLVLKAKKNKGDIAFFAGMATTMVGTGLFAKAAIRQHQINENHRSGKSEIEYNYEKYGDKEERKRLLKENAQLTLKETVKNFILPTTVSAAGYGLQLYGRHTYKDDLSKVSLALNGMTAAYEAIKAKIIENEGEDKWAEYANGVKVCNWQEGDPDTGAVQEMSDVEFGENYEPHTYLFYEPNPNWNPNKGCNKAFILGKLNETEFKLKKRGFILEIEILDILGEDPEVIKQLVKTGKVSVTSGIVYDENRPFERQVSFGLDSKDEATRRFMDELEPSVMLKFNCVNNIYDYI